MFKKNIIGVGCSFVRGSADDENIRRLNRGDVPTRPLKQNHIVGPYASNSLHAQTSFIIELAELLGVDSINHSKGGSGIRSLVFKCLKYVETENTDNDFIIFGLSVFQRFEFANDDILHTKWNKLPKEEYAKYYDRKDASVEITTLLKLLHVYLDYKGIEHIFINTFNYHHSTKEIIPTFIFPCGSEYWTDHIISYDKTAVERNHPNISDHKLLGKLLFDKLNQD
jgi:hypothetical protein